MTTTELYSAALDLAAKARETLPYCDSTSFRAGVVAGAVWGMKRAAGIAERISDDFGNIGADVSSIVASKVECAILKDAEVRSEK